MAAAALADSKKKSKVSQDSKPVPDDDIDDLFHNSEVGGDNELDSVFESPKEKKNKAPTLLLENQYDENTGKK